MPESDEPIHRLLEEIRMLSVEMVKANSRTAPGIACRLEQARSELVRLLEPPPSARGAAASGAASGGSTLAERISSFVDRRLGSLKRAG